MKIAPISVFGLFLLLLAACIGNVTPDSETPNPTPVPSKTAINTPEVTEAPTQVRPEEILSTTPLPEIVEIEQIDLRAVPDIDTAQHSVPLEEIIFDTFRAVNRAVPLTEVQPALIRSLRDAIPPLYEPPFVSIAATDKWLSDSDIVLGYADGDEAFAYPIKILNYHEMVSHQVNGRDILASYCPLCRSGIVFDRLLPGTGAPLLLGNTSALYESDMVMFDHQTGSYWNQVSGDAIVGPLTGQRMSILPAQMTTWGSWKSLYPDTLALSEDTGFDRNYRQDPFSGYGDRLNAGGQFFFPVSENGRDPRLDPAEIVLGLEVDGVHRAYPLELLGDNVVQDTLGNTEVVIFSQAAGPSGTAYSPQIDGRSLTFTLVNGRIQDQETGSIWNLAGRAIDGELAGAQLEPLPARATFWFSIVANFPDIEVYQP
ncbi:MAG: DUF3179 domain-containing protein [Anaerolineae bacterium]|nr:MAG: DUF3179 domain-containing protein [Anaerolineae bacterium]